MFMCKYTCLNLSICQPNLNMKITVTLAILSLVIAELISKNKATNIPFLRRANC